MSADRGKPVMLTNGERRLLIELCDKQIRFNEGLMPVYEAHKHHGEVREQIRVSKLRNRQYKRLILELSKPSPSPAPPIETGQG